ncbi:DUF4258 domain-containing protein [Candidatus Parcubacteria bacterium]|nr:DUF4258 domain-containing protein [Candidatus Parcubacteria bacterium]
MNIQFSDHASQQLKIRKKITRRMVKESVENPDKILASYRGRQVFQKRYEKEVLEVVAVVEDNRTVIITQYILE